MSAEELPPPSDPDELSEEDLAEIGRHTLSARQGVVSLALIGFGILVALGGAPEAFSSPQEIAPGVVVLLGGWFVGYGMGMRDVAVKLEESRMIARFRRVIRRIRS